MSHRMRKGPAPSSRAASISEGRQLFQKLGEDQNPKATGRNRQDHACVAVQKPKLCRDQKGWQHAGFNREEHRNQDGAIDQPWRRQAEPDQRISRRQREAQFDHRNPQCKRERICHHRRAADAHRSQTVAPEIHKNLPDLCR